MRNYISFEDWLESLGFSESSGKYDAINQFGYLGKYQMGESALADAGYYIGNSPSNLQEWKGEFLGKGNVKSKEDFLNNPQAQENAVREFMKKQWQYLKNNGSTKYVGSTINNIEITPAGLLAGAHLKGAGGVIEYLNSNGKKNTYDGNGTYIEKYIKQHSKGDVSEITDSGYYSPRWGQTKEDFVEQKAKQGANMIGQVAQKVNPQPQIPNKTLKDIPVQPPLSEEEWRKRLRRKRMGLL